jgi:S-adenosylmethionine-diacylgycerolhomoserine-N-methlytransferase
MSADGHGALMDRVYRRQRHFYNLTRRYYLIGRDRLIRQLKSHPGDSAVSTVSGSGRNLFAFARCYPGARLFGFDASQAMLETASRAVEQAGLSARIALRHGYAEDLTPGLFAEEQAFDCAIFSYSLSMIPDWRRAVSQADTALSAGGRLHIVDFGDLAGLGRFGASALRYWLRLFHVEPRAEILRALEEQQRLQSGLDLWISPGRYAFLCSAGRNRFPGLGQPNVAGQPQPQSNS